MAIIYTLFGDEGLYATEYHDQLLKLAQQYLLCGKEKENTKEEPVMDYIEDMDYIEASFQSDYNIDLENVKMHWWKFNNLINGLSNSEFGNCCILNQIINIRTRDITKIEDKKEREEAIKLKEKYALKRNKKQPTKEQQESANEFFKQLGL